MESFTAILVSLSVHKSLFYYQNPISAKKNELILDYSSIPSVHIIHEISNNKMWWLANWKYKQLITRTK